MSTSNQSALEVVGTRTIDQVRKDGLDKQTLGRIAQERQEMLRIKQDQKERLPGQFLSLKADKEKRTFLFTGNYQKLEVAAKDFRTRQEIPGKKVTKWRFQAYDVTDEDNPSDAGIWERGYTETEQVLHWLEQEKFELTIIRNGARNSQQTTYTIYPAAG